MSRRNKPGCLGSLVELVLWLLVISVPIIAITYIADWLHVSVWAAIALIFLAPVLLYLFVRLVQFLLRRLAQRPKATPAPVPAKNAIVPRRPAAQPVPPDEDPPEYDIPPQEPSIIINTAADLAKFQREHQLMETIPTKVVGVTYHNHEGTDRQHLLSLCHRGDPLTIVFYRYRGEPAYFVYAPCGEIGNLNRDLAADLYADYGDSAIFNAEITEVTGGYSGKSYGCNIRIDVYI